MDCKDHVPKWMDGYGIVSGDTHDWIEDEVIENARVQIIKCKKCERVSIAWKRP